ncbi:MAG: hypothetical protein KGL39_07300 [Patescibacteria group bacterium]|nr:hypothetical protein [Patescibacteria group bacterium]
MGKTTAETKSLSLVDTAGCKVREWLLVYHPREPWFWWAKYLKQGFRHVELTRPVQFGPSVEDVVWLNILPMFELLDAEISTDPRPPWVKCPGSTVQKVTTLQPLDHVRSWFDIGPPTCVEVVKAALGIRAFFVRTPWQLFNYIQQRGGIIDGRRRRR